jgi:glyoxylate carboligase
LRKHRLGEEEDKMRPKTAKTGAQVVVESLERQGVQYVFGIPGAKIDKVFDTLVSSSIQTVVCRHEQNAAFIAVRLSGSPYRALNCASVRGTLLAARHSAGKASLT